MDLDDYMSRAAQCGLSVMQRLELLALHSGPPPAAVAPRATVVLHSGGVWLGRLGQPYRHQSVVVGRDVGARARPSSVM